MLPDLSLLTILTIAFAFLVAGAVKGVVGVGITTIPVGLLTVAFDLTTAMALLLVPAFVTNIWQASVGGHLRLLVTRLWPFLLAASLPIWIGAQALTIADLTLLSAMLGTVLVCYGGLNLLGFRLSIPHSRERWGGPAFGFANGTLTGMTGSFVVPGVIYLQALGMPKDMLIQAMGLLFTASSIGLALALVETRIVTPELAAISTVALVPVTIGMIVGQQVRSALSEQAFRTLFFLAMLILGTYILTSVAVETTIALT